jgi:hypothetical protein
MAELYAFQLKEQTVQAWALSIFGSAVFSYAFLSLKNRTLYWAMPPVNIERRLDVHRNSKKKPARKPIKSTGQ